MIWSFLKIARFLRQTLRILRAWAYVLYLNTPFSWPYGVHKNTGKCTFMLCICKACNSNFITTLHSRPISSRMNSLALRYYVQYNLALDDGFELSLSFTVLLSHASFQETNMCFLQHSVKTKAKKPNANTNNCNYIIIYSWQSSKSKQKQAYPLIYGSSRCKSYYKLMNFNMHLLKCNLIKNCRVWFVSYSSYCSSEKRGLFYKLKKWCTKFFWYTQDLSGRRFEYYMAYIL